MFLTLRHDPTNPAACLRWGGVSQQLHDEPLYSCRSLHQVFSSVHLYFIIKKCKSQLSTADFLPTSLFSTVHFTVLMTNHWRKNKNCKRQKVLYSSLYNKKREKNYARIFFLMSICFVTSLNKNIGIEPKSCWSY